MIEFCDSAFNRLLFKSESEVNEANLHVQYLLEVDWSESY